MHTYIEIETYLMKANNKVSTEAECPGHQRNEAARLERKSRGART
jgi:hypothetical protein